MYADVIENQTKLQRLYTKADQLLKDDSTDVEIVSAFISYLCVRTYAYLESSIEAILREYVRSVSNDNVLERFVNAQLRHHRNLNRSELLRLLGNFSDEWRAKIRDAIKGRLGDSLDSIVNLRNGIAHGSDSSDVSFVTLKNYFADSNEVVRLVFEVCSPMIGPLAA